MDKEVAVCGSRGIVSAVVYVIREIIAWKSERFPLRPSLTSSKVGFDSTLHAYSGIAHVPSLPQGLLSAMGSEVRLCTEPVVMTEPGS